MIGTTDEQDFLLDRRAFVPSNQGTAERQLFQSTKAATRFRQCIKPSLDSNR
jgi:hypothetical protein